jgi:T5orf172 domain
MKGLYDQEKWDKIAECMRRYMEAREAHITDWQNHTELFGGYSDLEIYWCEAGEILFQMFGIPGIPTQEEMGKQGPRPKALLEAIKPPKKGFVYLIRNHRNGYVKIGWSTKPAQREATLQSQEPEISMLAKVPSYRHFEEQLHERFASQRVRGEWFDLRPPQITALIQEFEGTHA